MQPNLQRWTGFGLLIIWGLNSDDFPFFFGTSLALLEAELAPFKDWAKSYQVWSHTQKVTRNGCFSRPAETDPYTVKGWYILLTEQ